MVIGESRSELLSWLNATLNLNYSKVEQCGTGAAFCQLMDCIHGGVPMSKVKFTDNLSEYDARSNMKILQAAFNRNHISKQIDVERLIKCRLQDNLELLQWFKRHWNDHKDLNIEYDASSARRKSSGTRTPVSGALSRRNTITPNQNVTNIGSTAKLQRSVSGSATMGANSGVASLISLPKRRVSAQSRPSSASSQDATRMVSDMSNKLEQAKLDLSEAHLHMETLETERNFYFNKLREIEILTQNIQHAYAVDDPATNDLKEISCLDFVTQVQEILWFKESGFDVAHDDEHIDAESF